MSNVTTKTDTTLARISVVMNQSNTPLSRDAPLSGSITSNTLFFMLLPNINYLSRLFNHFPMPARVTFGRGA